MKNLQTFDEFVNESLLNEAAGIQNKDWDRMLDLVMKGDNGEKAAKLITDKNKAIYRFITGLKLANQPLEYKYSSYWGGYFSELGNKALSLGATPEEIEALYNNTEVPDAYIQKMNKLEGKKLNNRFVGDISKAVLDAGFDIKYLPHNGYAITRYGAFAMGRNGSKWTIGYKTQIDLGNNKVVDFIFDAITDEGNGPTYYIADYSSDKIFNELNRNPAGKQKFIADLKEILKNQK